MNVISKFFPNYVTVRHCEFSEKDDTDKEFLDVEVPSTYNPGQNVWEKVPFS